MAAALGKNDYEQAASQGSFDEEINSRHVIAPTPIHEQRPAKSREETDHRPSTNLGARHKHAWTHGGKKDRVEETCVLRCTDSRYWHDTPLLHSHPEYPARRATPPMNPRRAGVRQRNRRRNGDDAGQDRVRYGQRRDHEKTERPQQGEREPH